MSKIKYTSIKYKDEKDGDVSVKILHNAKILYHVKTNNINTLKRWVASRLTGKGYEFCYCGDAWLIDPDDGSSHACNDCNFHHGYQ